jgi:hypothetical protein
MSFFVVTTDDVPVTTNNKLVTSGALGIDHVYGNATVDPTENRGAAVDPDLTLKFASVRTEDWQDRSANVDPQDDTGVEING